MESGMVSELRFSIFVEISRSPFCSRCVTSSVWAKGNCAIHSGLRQTSSRVVSHGSQLRLTGRTIIVRVAHNALSPRQSSAVGLVDDVLKRIQQFTTLIEQQTGVSPFN